MESLGLLSEGVTITPDGNISEEGLLGLRALVCNKNEWSSGGGRVENFRNSCGPIIEERVRRAVRWMVGKEIDRIKEEGGEGGREVLEEKIKVLEGYLKNEGGKGGGEGGVT